MSVYRHLPPVWCVSAASLTADSLSAACLMCTSASLLLDCRQYVWPVWCLSPSSQRYVCDCLMFVSIQSEVCLRLSDVCLPPVWGMSTACLMSVCRLSDSYMSSNWSLYEVSLMSVVCLMSSVISLMPDFLKYVWLPPVCCLFLVLCTSAASLMSDCTNLLSATLWCLPPV